MCLFKAQQPSPIYISLINAFWDFNVERDINVTGTRNKFILCSCRDEKAPLGLVTATVIYY